MKNKVIPTTVNETPAPMTYRDIKKKRKSKKDVKPPDAGKKQGPSPRVSDEKILELLAEGKSHVVIAKMYGYTRGIIRNRIKGMGVQIPDLRKGIGSQRRQRVYLLVQETVDQINELAAKTGMGKGEIIEKSVEKFKKDWEAEYAGI